METNILAREYIEQGMGASIALRDELEKRFKRSLDGGEISCGEYHRLVIACGNWDMQSIDRFGGELAGRGIEMEDVMFFLKSYISENLRQSPQKLVEFLLEVTNPEFLAQIEEMSIPLEISHIFQVIGWNRIGFSVERLEAAMVSLARSQRKQQRKEGK